jgi:hypothetical protein
VRSEVQIFPDPPFSGFRRWSAARIANYASRHSALNSKKWRKVWVDKNVDGFSATTNDVVTQDFFRLARRLVSEQTTRPDGKKTSHGAIAQLGERLPCTQEVGGSIPPGSTNFTGEFVASVKSLNERKAFPLKIYCSLTIWKFLTS